MNYACNYIDVEYMGYHMYMTVDPDSLTLMSYRLEPQALQIGMHHLTRGNIGSKLRFLIIKTRGTSLDIGGIGNITKKAIN